MWAACGWFRISQFDWQLLRNQIAKFVANFENTEQNPLVKSFVKCFVKVILSYNLFPKRQIAMFPCSLKPLDGPHDKNEDFQGFLI